MADLGDIRIGLKADTAGFKSAMKGALGAVTAVTAAMGAAVTAAVKMTTSMANVGDEAAKAGARVGLSAEAIQELGFAAGQSGTDIDRVKDGLKDMGKNASEAAQGTGGAVDAFDRLGISVTDVNGAVKSTDALFMETAEALSGVENSADRSALAMKIFGEAGHEMLPMLNQGADGIASMRAEARELGIVLSNETAAASEEFNDNLARLKGSMTGLKNEIGTALLPVLNAGVEELVAMSKELLGTGKAADITKKAVTGVTEVVKALAPALTVAGALAGALVDAFKLLDIGASTLAIMVGTATEGILMMKDAIEGTEESGQELAAFQQRLGALVGETRQKIDSFGEATKKGAEFGDKLADATNRIAEAMKNGTKETKEFLAAQQELLGGGAQGPVNPRANTGTGGGGGGGGTSRRDPNAGSGAIPTRRSSVVDAEVMGVVNGINTQANTYAPQDSNSTPGSLPTGSSMNAGLAADAMNQVVDSSGMLSNALAVATGGISEVVRIFADLWASSEAFAEAMGRIQSIFDGVFGEAINMIGENAMKVLRPIFDLLDALAPILETVFVVMSPFSMILKVVGQAFEAIAKPIDAFVTAVKRAVNSIKVFVMNIGRRKSRRARVREDGTIYDPKDESTWRNIETETSTASGAGSRSSSVAGAGDSLFAAISGVKVGAEALGKSFRELTDGTKKATESMLNVPTIFARNLRRGQAGNVSGNSLSQLGAAAREQSGQQWHVTTMNVYADDPDEMAERVRRSQYVRSGSSVRDAASFVYEQV